MMRDTVFNRLFHSFPWRLFVSQLKRHHILLAIWLLLFAIITNTFGKYLGIPSLFLEPEYLNQVNFLSYFILGVILGSFIISYHVTFYIVEAYKYPFLGSLNKPFARFSLNNSLLPLAFFTTYLIKVLHYLLDNAYSNLAIWGAISGLFVGLLIITAVLYTYFWFTNKDIFKVIAYRFDQRLKRSIPPTRANAMARLVLIKQKPERVRYYLDFNFKLQKVKDRGYDRSEVLKVFDQNHLNLILIELLIIILLLLVGIFRDIPAFQLPAAGSALLFMTIIIILTGAFSYWFKSWSTLIIIGLVILINLGIKYNFFKTYYPAFGINYENGLVDYNNQEIAAQNSDSLMMLDRLNTLAILEHWKAKFSDKKPKMVLLAVSGGGQRSALWTFNALKNADILSNGELFNHSMLITGASGGLIGAAFYRELKYRKLAGQAINPYNDYYQQLISKDNLNPIIYSFLVNDMFVRFQEFTYNNHKYVKDRGYSFEEQLNINTLGFLDKPLFAYRQAEATAKIPMMIVAPTIINDGRKLFISPQHVSYMNLGNIRALSRYDKLSEGIDFRRFYKKLGADSLRFLSALRMGATFPYVTPNISLPSNPPMEIMDAGLTDNFGISDALRFLYAFRTWIAQNTSGVVLLSIRDSPRQVPIDPRKNLSLFDKLFTPVQSVYANYSKMQSITNDSKIEYATSWFDNQLDVLYLQYTPVTSNAGLAHADRAALSWRLTPKEKKSVLYSIKSPTNQLALEKLRLLLK